MEPGLPDRTHQKLAAAAPKPQKPRRPRHIADDPLPEPPRPEAGIQPPVTETGLPVEEQVEKEWLATIPAGRFGAPEELGAAIAFLCTPAAAYINGINLPVDGGRLGTL